MPVTGGKFRSLICLDQSNFPIVSRYRKKADGPFANERCTGSSILQLYDKLQFYDQLVKRINNSHTVSMSALVKPMCIGSDMISALAALELGQVPAPKAYRPYSVLSR